MLEIDQVTPGSSLGQAIATLGWSLKEARAETWRSLGTCLCCVKSHVPDSKPSAQECSIGVAY